MVDSASATIYATQCQGCIDIFIGKAQTVEAISKMALTKYVCLAETVTAGSSSAPIDVRVTGSNYVQFKCYVDI